MSLLDDPFLALGSGSADGAMHAADEHEHDAFVSFGTSSPPAPSDPLAALTAHHTHAPFAFEEASVPGVAASFALKSGHADSMAMYCPMPPLKPEPDHDMLHCADADGDEGEADDGEVIPHIGGLGSGSPTLGSMSLPLQPPEPLLDSVLPRPPAPAPAMAVATTTTTLPRRGVKREPPSLLRAELPVAAMVVSPPMPPLQALSTCSSPASYGYGYGSPGSHASRSGSSCGSGSGSASGTSPSESASESDGLSDDAAPSPPSHKRANLSSKSLLPPRAAAGGAGAGHKRKGDASGAHSGSADMSAAFMAAAGAFGALPLGLAAAGMHMGLPLGLPLTTGALASTSTASSPTLNSSAALTPTSAASASGASGQSVALDMTGQPLVGDKRAQRLQRNRASAQLSRERKKQYVRLLEAQLKEMSDLNEGLTSQLAALTSENHALKERLARLAVRERVRAQMVRKPAPAPAVDDGSDGASTCSATMSAAAASMSSAPHSPSSEGEWSAPTHTKRLKVAACSSPNSAPSGGAPLNVRTGMLLFSLVMSVTLFCSLAGVDVAPASSSLRSVSPVSVAGPASSVQIEEVPSILASVGAAVGSGRSGGVSGPRRVLAGLDLPPSASVPEVASSATGVSSGASDDAFALVPLSPSSSSGSTAASTRASSPTLATTTVADESKALDVYSRASSLSEKTLQLSALPSPLLKSSPLSALGLSAGGELLDLPLLRRLHMSANLTLEEREGAHYLLCPQAVRLTESMWQGMVGLNATAAVEAHVDVEAEQPEEDGSMAVSIFERPAGRGVKRARGAAAGAGKRNVASRLRNRLPSAPALPSPTDATAASPLLSPASSADAPPLQEGDKLLLWLPLGALAPNSTDGSHAHAHTAPASAGDASKGGLLEIACSISHMRPVRLS